MQIRQHTLDLNDVDKMSTIGTGESEKDRAEKFTNMKKKKKKRKERFTKRCGHLF